MNNACLRRAPRSSSRTRTTYPNVAHAWKAQMGSTEPCGAKWPHWGDIISSDFHFIIFHSAVLWTTAFCYCPGQILLNSQGQFSHKIWTDNFQSQICHEMDYRFLDLPMPFSSVKLRAGYIFEVCKAREFFKSRPGLIINKFF